MKTIRSRSCILAATLACVSAPTFAQDASRDSTPAHRESEAVGPDMFPPGTFPLVRGAPDLRNAWYARHLRAANEPPLWTAPSSPIDAVRVTVLPTWGRPVVVRVAPQGGRYVVIGTRLSGSGGYEPGTPEATTRTDMTPAQWRDLTQRIDAIGFFQMPTTATMGRDGEQWILEVRRGTTYHLVDRWMPQSDAVTMRYVALCQWIAALSGPVWSARGPAGRR